MAAPASRQLPDRARVVVIGGGVIGCSVAYHLAHAGWTDVLLLERDRLTSGTTWHAAGLMTCFGSTSETSTGIRLYSRDLYARLEEETGQATGFKPVGLIEAAADEDRLEEYRRVAAFQRTPRAGGRGDLAAGDGRPVPLGEDRRPARRLPRPRRRPGQPGRRHHRAGQGRPTARRARSSRASRSRTCSSTAGASTGVRVSTGAPGRDDRDRGRVRRQLRRHVGPRAGGEERAGDPQPGGRALLPDHRHHRRARPRRAGVRGPRVVRLLPRGGRRDDGRPLRAAGGAVEGRGHPARLLLRQDPARLGPDEPVPGEGHGPRPGHPRGRRPHLLLRSGVVHPRPRPRRRRGSRDPQLLRRRGHELGRHPLRRRPRPGAGPLDHHRPAGRRRHRLQRRPVPPVAGRRRLPRRAHHGDPRHGVRRAHARQAAAHRPQHAALPGARPAGRAGRLPARGVGLGGRRLVRRPGRHPGGRAHLGPGAVVRAVGGRAPGRPRGRRPDGHELHGEVPGAGRRRRRRARPGLRGSREREGRDDHLHPVARRGRPDRGRPDGHQAGRGRLLRGRLRHRARPHAGLAGAPHRRTPTARSPTSPPTTASSTSRDPGRARCSPS